MKITLRRLDGSAIAEGEWGSLREAVEANKANLTGASLTGASLTRASLTGANLTGASLTRASLDGANLTGANLDGANLTEASLTRASLDGANLTGANLYRASLTEASLTRASLTGANLTGANLTGANLTAATLDGANLDDTTVMPGGETWAAYQSEVVPALLTAGGKSIGEVLATGCWDCHEWSNCPMHAALGIDSESQAPALLRPRVREFVALFDARLIPKPEIPAVA